MGPEFAFQNNQVMEYVKLLQDWAKSTEGFRVQQSALNPPCSTVLGIWPSGSKQRKLLQKSELVHPWSHLTFPSQPESLFKCLAPQIQFLAPLFLRAFKTLISCLMTHRGPLWLRMEEADKATPKRFFHEPEISTKHAPLLEHYRSARTDVIFSFDEITWTQCSVGLDKMH